MKTILVVDDDALMLGVMKDALRREYSITCVSNGQEAQDLLTQEKYDLVITDLVMPEMNGIELLMTLQNNDPTQKIIAISGGGGITGRFDYLPVAQLIGANNVLRKPFQVAELRSIVKDLLN